MAERVWLRNLGSNRPSGRGVRPPPARRCYGPSAARADAPRLITSEDDHATIPDQYRARAFARGSREMRGVLRHRNSPERASTGIPGETAPSQARKSHEPNAVNSPERAQNRRVV